MPDVRRLAQRIVMETLVFNPLASKLFPFRPPPILLLSYPRSGSSWVGKILSHSPDLVYLREPINQPFLQRMPRKTFWNPDATLEARDIYTTLATRAFAGVPPRGVHGAVDSPWDFLPQRRGRRRLLIKEVNPLAIDFFAREWELRIAPLLRHPGAVAESYRRMGWLSGNLADFGRRYGERMAHVIEVVDGGPSSAILYEELAAEPRDGFLELFARLEVRPPSNYAEVIDRLCHADRDPNSPYDVRRTSAEEITKWREGLHPGEIDDLREGFFQSPLEYYRSSDDWP